MTDPAADGPVLFAERGGSWWWLAVGPVAGAAMAGVQYAAGSGWQPAMPLVFVVVLSGFLAVQVHAARIHASVELTAATLRQGTRRLPVAEIRRVHPAPEAPRGTGRDGGRDGERDPEPWQSAPALGELSGVPKGRRGVGLHLTGGRTVQAWARDDSRLRETLRGLVDHGAASDTARGASA